jgi:hypothetical protein
MRSGFIAFFISCALANATHAGAWVQAQGQGLLIAQATYYDTDSYFDANGDVQPQARYSKYELQPYIEYGATQWLTLGGSAYVQSVAQSGARNAGIADPELFARARLYRDDTHIVSIQPLVKLASRFDEGSNPRGGSKSTDMELSLLYGRNLALISARDYADARIGYRQRDRGLSPQWRADLAVGLGVGDAIQIVPAIRTVIATAAQDATTFVEGGDLDYSVMKLEVTGIYHLNDTQWLQAGIFSHAVGVQTGDGYGFTLGFAQRF